MAHLAFRNHILPPRFSTFPPCHRTTSSLSRFCCLPIYVPHNAIVQTPHGGQSHSLLRFRDHLLVVLTHTSFSSIDVLSLYRGSCDVATIREFEFSGREGVARRYEIGSSGHPGPCRPSLDNTERFGPCRHQKSWDVRTSLEHLSTSTTSYNVNCLVQSGIDENPRCSKWPTAPNNGSRIMPCDLHR